MVLILLHVLVLQAYWVLAESRIPLKLGAWELLHFPLFHNNSLNETCLLFSNSVGSLYSISEGSNFPDYLVITWVTVFRIIPEFRILRKVSLKMLNWKNYNRFSYLHTVCLKTVDYLFLKL